MNRNNAVEILLLGLPNSGKSTLINALTKNKTSIIGSKPNTTRDKISKTISYENDKDIIISDLPGFLDKPDEFNIQRENAEKHLAFGIGRHTCLGKPIALMQLNEFYSQFLKRFPDFEMNGEWKVAPNNFVHAIQEMPIKFTKE